MQRNLKKVFFVKNNMIIFGNTNLADLANYYFEHDGNYQVSAFVVDDEFYDTESFCDKPVVPFSKMLVEYPPEQYDLFVAVGYTNQNRTRENLYYRCKKMGYTLPSYVSSKATVFDTLKVGDNCFILEDNTIQPFAVIGNDVVLWSGNHIGHHAVIEDHCFITSHVVVSGGVHVGRNCFIGVNTSIRDHISIGNHCLIGAGSWIHKNTEPYGIYSNEGTKRVREVEKNDKMGKARADF